MAHSFTGTDGIMLKTTTIDAVSRYDQCDGPGTMLLDRNNEVVEDDQPVELPKIQFLVSTKSAQCGISSKWLKHAKKKNLPATLYELVQEMGRVDRLLLAEPGSNTYEVHISFASYTSMYVRKKQNPDRAERKIQMSARHLRSQSYQS